MKTVLSRPGANSGGLKKTTLKFQAGSSSTNQKAVLKQQKKTDDDYLEEDLEDPENLELYKGLIERLHKKYKIPIIAAKGLSIGTIPQKPTQTPTNQTQPKVQPRPQVQPTQTNQNQRKNSSTTEKIPTNSVRPVQKEPSNSTRPVNQNQTNQTNQRRNLKDKIAGIKEKKEEFIRNNTNNNQESCDIGPVDKEEKPTETKIVNKPTSTSNYHYTYNPSNKAQNQTQTKPQTQTQVRFNKHDSPEDQEPSQKKPNQIPKNVQVIDKENNRNNNKPNTTQPSSGYRKYSESSIPIPRDTIKKPSKGPEDSVKPNVLKKTEQRTDNTSTTFVVYSSKNKNIDDVVKSNRLFTKIERIVKNPEVINKLINMKNDNKNKSPVTNNRLNKIPQDSYPQKNNNTIEKPKPNTNNNINTSTQNKRIFNTTSNTNLRNVNSNTVNKSINTNTGKISTINSNINNTRKYSNTNANTNTNTTNVNRVLPTSGASSGITGTNTRLTSRRPLRTNVERKLPADSTREQENKPTNVIGNISNPNSTQRKINLSNKTTFDKNKAINASANAPNTTKTNSKK